MGPGDTEIAVAGAPVVGATLGLPGVTVGLVVVGAPLFLMTKTGDQLGLPGVTVRLVLVGLSKFGGPVLRAALGLPGSTAGFGVTVPMIGLLVAGDPPGFPGNTVGPRVGAALGFPGFTVGPCTWTSVRTSVAGLAEVGDPLGLPGRTVGPGYSITGAELIGFELGSPGVVVAFVEAGVLVLTESLIVGLTLGVPGKTVGIVEMGWMLGWPGVVVGADWIGSVAVGFNSTTTCEGSELEDTVA